MQDIARNVYASFYLWHSITKTKINKRGYNKFLDMSDNVSVTINKDKITEDAQWDGFKGYITNTDLTANNVYNQYSELRQVERAFRVTKGVLEIRPMFHFTKKRIEAHVAICFVAYKVYKELERILKIKQMPTYLKNIFGQPFCKVSHCQSQEIVVFLTKKSRYGLCNRLIFNELFIFR